MRANRGFTVLELVVVLGITAVVASLIVWQGRSARHNAGLAGGVYDLAIQISNVKARALADGRDYFLVVVDTPDPEGCVERESRCGRVLVLRDDADPGLAIKGFDPDPPIVGAEFVEETFLPRNSQIEPDPAWRAPPPFDAVQAWRDDIPTECADGLACFALRFTADGEVRPQFAGAPTNPAGFAFVLRPITAPSGAAERRALFVSFPGGIVKTAAF
jgi:prepilin-type N-terminal cleavage/methylation domain-containing protein